MAMKYCLQIAGVNIVIESDQELIIGTDFVPFIKNCKDDYSYKAVFKKTEVLPIISDKKLYKGLCYEVYPNGENAYKKYFYDDLLEKNTPYGFARYDFVDRKVFVEYLPKCKKNVGRLSNCLFHISWERMMLQEQRLVFHAACVETKMGGILFAGVSGIGKSTQANLWCEKRGAKLINGDRPIIGKKDNRWHAYGSPYAGSSKCYVNDSCEINAIVMLKQEENCSLRKLTARESFGKVYSGLIINTWDKEFVEKASLLAMRLIQEVPVYEFSCTPDERAVIYLEKNLQEVR